jgi:hypothetical protein
VDQVSPRGTDAPLGHARADLPTGIGLGLRWSFLDDVLETARSGAPSAIDFFEVSPENYMRRGGYFPEALDEISSRWPILAHGLTMSFGGLDEIDEDYLRALRGFITRVRAPFHSDHLCFGGTGGRLVHDLLPLPFIGEAVDNAARRIRKVRDALEVPIAIENISYYLVPGAPEMSEAAFLSEVLERSDAGLLLDVNNVVVNAKNFGFDAARFVDELPLERVMSIHVAGHEHKADEGRYIDTHGAATSDAALELLTSVVARTGPLPVVLERDHNVPAFSELLDEVARVRRAYELGLARRAA